MYPTPGTSLSVAVLGGLRVVVDGAEVAVSGRRLRALLVRLAVAGRPVPVGELAAAVWPDRAPADERHALQALVSRLRRQLGGRVRAVDDGYLLDAADTDVRVFESAVDDGRRALRDGRPDAAARRLREALDLWRGTPLADAGDAAYATALTARLEALRLDAVEARIDAELRLGHHRQLVAELHQLTAAHPLRERPRTLLVRALHADGRPAEALAAYEEHRSHLADELGTDPGEELRAAHLAALRDAERPRRRGNLRAPVTSFVGRDGELDQVAGALAAGRLVTLVGPGGAGKTRLATVAGARHEDATGRPTWLVDLAAVSDPGDLVPAVLDATGAHGSPATSTDRGLANALAAADALLLLDNCEHLLEQVAALVEELVGRCPALRVLATSREPLRVGGETLCEVGPLPDEPAVRLFRDRAAAVLPGFADDPAAVTDVCRRLDGLPLAIELAAARLRTMPLHQLAARLDDRFRLLATGRHGVPARHRTLRAVVAWSWDLLDADQRDAAARLTVFPSTFTADAAAHVGVPQEQLDPLVDKSLLQLADRAAVRYRMSSTVRQYGLERLDEAGRRAEAAQAHLAYVLDLAERAEPHLRGPGQLPWLATLRAERDDLHAALRFALDTQRAEAAVRLAAALGLFWTMHGDHAEVEARLRGVLDLAELAAADLPADALVAVTATYLLNAVFAGHGEQARKAVHVPDATSDPLAALVASSVTAGDDDPSAGAALLLPHLDHPNPWKRGVLRLFLAFLFGSHGGWREMSADLEAAAAAFGEAGERWGLATALTYLGMVHSALGEHEDAVAELGRAAGLAGELGHAEPQQVWLAIAKLQAGDTDAARTELAELAAEVTSADCAVLARLRLADLARQDGDLSAAAAQLDGVASLLGPRAADDPMYLAASGALAVARGDLAAAGSQLRAALTLATRMPDLPMAAAVAVSVAGLAHRRGDPAGAAEALGAADAVRGTVDPTDVDAARLHGALVAHLGDEGYATAHRLGSSHTTRAALARLEQLTTTR